MAVGAPGFDVRRVLVLAGFVAIIVIGCGISGAYFAEDAGPSTKHRIAQAEEKIRGSFLLEIARLEETVANASSWRRQLELDLGSAQSANKVLEQKLHRAERKARLATRPARNSTLIKPIKITGGAGDEACDVMFVVFYIAKTNTSKLAPHQLYTVQSAQRAHPGCPVVILSDSVSDTAAWEALGEEVSVRRLDPARTAQMRATSEMMLFRHIMETELLRKLAREVRANQEQGRPVYNVVFLDSDVLVVQPLSEVFDPSFARRVSNNSHSTFAVAMTYRGGCASKFRSRCRLQPINTGVKMVVGARVREGLAWFNAALRLWGRNDTRPGNQACPSMVVGDAAERGLAAFPESVRRLMIKRQRSHDLFLDGMCDQAAFYKALDMYSESQMPWGRISRSAHPHQVTLQYASGRKQEIGLMFLPCYKYNSILAGRHSDDCQPNPRQTSILHFKGKHSKDKGRVLWSVLKTENSMAAVLQAAKVLKPEE